MELRRRLALHRSEQLERCLSRGLREIRFPERGRPARPEKGWQEDAGPFREATRQLEEYFAGTRRKFDLKLAPTGTPFQLEVRKALRTIPYDRTVSYGEIAQRIGRPSASRAAGSANGRNPLPIVVPCHRVIGADGSLTGYGGGLWRKQRLLALDRGQPIEGLLVP